MISPNPGSQAGVTGPQPQPDAAFWSVAPVEAIERLLSHSGFVAGAECADGLRDRAAALVLSDPQLSLRISRALLGAVRRCEARTEPVVRATAYRCRAEACMFTGRLAAARSAYERATSEAARAQAHLLLGRILVGRIHLLSLLGEAAQAGRLDRRAEGLLRRAGDAVYLGKLYMNRGNAHYQRDRYEDAYRAYGRATRVFEQSGMRDATWVGLLMNQAIACTNLSRIAEARALFLKTEQECERLNLDALWAMARLNRAFLESLRGDYRVAIHLLEEAESCFERLGSRDMLASARRSRAEIYLDLGMPAEALEIARSAAQVYAAEGMVIDAALARIDEARCRLALHQIVHCEELLREVHAFFVRRKLRPRQAVTLLHLAWAELAGGQAAAATSLARRALRTGEALGLTRSVVEARRVLVEAALAQGRPASAGRSLEPLLARPRSLSLGERFEAWWLAGRVARAAGRPAEAAARLRRAARLLEEQRHLVPGPELRARAFERHVGVYHDLLGLALDSPRPRFEAVYHLTESARARIFGERLRAGRERWAERQTAGDARARRLSQRGERLAARQAQLASITHRLEQLETGGQGAPSARAVAELRRQMLALEREVTEEIRRLTARADRADLWGGAPHARAVQRRLAEDEILLQYFLIEDRVLALVLGRGRRRVFLLPTSAAEIRTHLERVEFLFGAAALAARHPHPGRLEFQRDSAEEALAVLYKDLIAPLSVALGAVRRLLLVPHGWLHQVPFECLYGERAYLSERVECVRCPGGDFILARDHRRSLPSGQALLCAVVESGPAFAGDELDAVAAHFPSRGRRVLRDPTRRAMLRHLPGSRIVHLATHGAFRADNPLFSRLSTADGALFLADLLDLSLQADLVVLSACESGQAHLGPGDDLSGVAHGFLAAGAQCLLAARWRIHDEATRALIAAFYSRYLAHGGRGPRTADAAAALAAAQGDVRGRWDHPFYWAGFSVFGR